MGVTYKLTEDVILFILEKKRDEPSLSVRKLAEISSEKFQREISKSSVSTVLKNAALNSSVGRPSKEKEEGVPPAGKIFKIPEKRKQELRDRVEKGEKSILIPVKPLPSKEDQTKAVDQLRAALEAFEKPIAQPERRKGPRIPEQEPQENRPTLLPDVRESKAAPKPEDVSSIIPSEEKEKSPESPKDIAQERKISDILANIELQINQRAHSKNKYSAGGIIFFKAAEWLAAKEPLLASLLSGHYRNQGVPMSSWDTAVSLYSLEKTSADLSETFHDYFLGLFHKESDPHLAKAVSQINSLEMTRDFLMDYDSVKSQMGMQVSMFQVFTEDKEFTFDPHFHLLSEGRSGGLLPFYHAMRNLSEIFISNQRDIMICTNPAPKALSGTYRDLIALCENMGQTRIKAVHILDDKKQKISEVTSIPHKHRNFVFGLWPWNEELKGWEYLAEAQRKMPFYCQAFNEAGYFIEIEYIDADLKRTMENFRVIYFWKKDDKEPLCALLTNHEGCKAEDLLNRFLNQCASNSDLLGNNILKKKASAPTPSDFLEKLYYPQELNKLQDVLRNYEELLWYLCWQIFFGYSGALQDINHLKSVLYEAKAEVFETDKLVFISLIRRSLPSHVEHVQSAIDTFNLSHIQDQNSRQIVLSLI